jgi:hypothetical protein
VEARGLEPPTNGFEVRCSSQLSYAPKFSALKTKARSKAVTLPIGLSYFSTVLWLSIIQLNVVWCKLFFRIRIR